MQYLKTHFLAILTVCVWQIVCAINVQASHIDQDDDNTVVYTNPLEIPEIQFHVLEFLSPHEIRQMGSINRNWKEIVDTYKIIRGPLKAEFDAAIHNHGFTIEKIDLIEPYRSYRERIDNFGISHLDWRSQFKFEDHYPIQIKQINKLFTCISADNLKYGGSIRSYAAGSFKESATQAAIFSVEDTDNYHCVLPKNNMSSNLWALNYDSTIALGTLDYDRRIAFRSTFVFYKSIPFMWNKKKGITYLCNLSLRNFYSKLKCFYGCMDDTGEIIGGYTEKIDLTDKYYSSAHAHLWISGEEYLLKDIIAHGFTSQQQELVKGLRLDNVIAISPNGHYMIVRCMTKLKNEEGISKTHYFKIHF